MPAVHSAATNRYRADNAFHLPPLATLLPRAEGGTTVVGGGAPVVEGEPLRQELEATYFDTADLRLSAAGIVLCRRAGDVDPGWQLAGPAGGASPAEFRMPAGRATRSVPEVLRRMVRAHTRGSLLRPVVEVLTHRTERRLIDATGQVLATVADDRKTARRLLPAGTGTAAADGASADTATLWREIEVALADGATELHQGLDARLRQSGLSSASKANGLDGVLGAARTASRKAVKKADKKECAGKLSARSEAAAVVLTHVREQVEQIRRQDLPVRLDAPDAVHKMRVATRRLRSALTTFKPLLRSDVVRPLRAELKWLAAELGAARDAEVMRDRVAATVDAGSGLDAAASGDAVRELDGTYRAAHERVLGEMDGERYHRLLADLDALLSAPPLTDRAGSRAGKVLPQLVGRSYTVVRRLVEQAESRADGAEREELFHDARKAAKAARYTAEAVANVFPADATAFAEAMEAVQEALGEHQDSVLTRERLRESALSTSSTEAAFLYGRLYALEELRSEEYRDRFAVAWKAAGRKSLHRWTR
jgi:CHAD domain-containing protein